MSLKSEIESLKYQLQKIKAQHKDEMMTLNDKINKLVSERS